MQALTKYQIKIEFVCIKFKSILFNLSLITLDLLYIHYVYFFYILWSSVLRIGYLNVRSEISSQTRHPHTIPMKYYFGMVMLQQRSI